MAFNYIRIMHLQQSDFLYLGGSLLTFKIDGVAKRWEAMETMTDYFLGLQNHCGW